MGFVVEQHLNDTFAEDIPRSDMAVVYGKNDYMWQVGKCTFELVVLKAFQKTPITIFTAASRN